MFPWDYLIALAESLIDRGYDVLVYVYKAQQLLNDNSILDTNHLQQIWIENDVYSGSLELTQNTVLDFKTTPNPPCWHRDRSGSHHATRNPYSHRARRQLINQKNDKHT